MTQVWHWMVEIGKPTLETVGIIGGLLFTSLSFRADIRSRRVNNLITLTQQHRDLWEEIQAKPALARVLEPKADLVTHPPTIAEKQFVNLAILHLHSWLRAAQQGEVRQLEGLNRDMQGFFSLPIPALVWKEKQEFYDADFVEYVEGVIRSA